MKTFKIFLAAFIVSGVVACNKESAIIFNPDQMVETDNHLTSYQRPQPHSVIISDPFGEHHFQTLQKPAEKKQIDSLPQYEF